jgi:tetratricopeptide (TPR) repeat protein
VLEHVWRLEVARLIPEIEPNLTLNEAMPEGRSRFFEGITRAVVLLAGDASIVLDDLQYFDASSLELLGLLARRPLAVGKRIVVTVRGAAINQQHQIAVLLDALEREGLLERFELQPLSESGVQALVANLADHLVDETSISFLYAVTGGNPLYTLETVRGLLESNTDSDWSKQLESPSTFSQVVQKRLEGLGASLKRLLEAASVAGNGFILEWLGEASALTDWEALESLERAVGAGLIEAQITAGETRGYRFAHDVVRNAILEGLGTERERLVHRKLASALEAYDAPSDRIALHLERSGQAKRAVPHRVNAAQAAASVFAYKAALTHYAQALEDGASDREEFFIRQARVTMLQNLDDRINWDAEITALEKTADLLRDPKLEAAALLARAAFELVIGNYSQSARLAQSARVHLDGRDPLFSQALYREGAAYYRLSQLAQAQACFRSALELTSPKDFERLGEIHNALSRSLIDRGDLIAARIHNEDAVAAYRRAQHLHGEVVAVNLGGWISFLQGETESALAVLLESFERAREYGLVLLQRGIIINLSAVLVTTGQLERAEQFIQQGLQLAREPREPRLEGMFHTHLGHIAERRGNLGGFLEHFVQAIDIFDRVGATAHAISARLNIAHYFLICGNPERAKPLVEQARRAIEASGVQNHHVWLEGLQLRCQMMLHQTFTTTRLEAALAASNRPEVSARLDLARAKFELGDATEALELAAGIESPPSDHAEALAVQLSAQRALRLHSNAKLEQALNLLSAAEVPALNKLSLYASVIATLEQTSDAQTQRDQAQKLMTKLATTLEVELQARFLEFWSEKLNPKPKLAKRH